MHFGRAQKIAFIVGLSLLLLSQFSPALSQESVEQAQTEIGTVNRELGEATNRYDEIVLSIERLNDEIEAREREIDTLRHQMSQSSQALNKRLAGIYKHGQVSLLEVLLGSRSVDDFTQRLNFLSRITRSDVMFLRGIEEKKRALEENKDQLERIKEEQAHLLADLAQTKYQIESRLREKQSLLATLRAEENAKSSPPTPAQPTPSPRLTRSEEGLATYYNYTGGYTAAHRTLPLGTKVLVTNLSNGRQVWVEIVDRGPWGEGRIIDLEKTAFSQIADPGRGVIYVRIEW